MPCDEVHAQDHRARAETHEKIHAVLFIKSFLRTSSPGAVRPEARARAYKTVTATGVPRSLDPPPSVGPYSSICLGSYGGPWGGGGLFLVSEVPPHKAIMSRDCLIS